MPLNLASYLLGNHVFFFREGDAFTVPAPGTASRLAKPGPTDPKWIPLGIVEEASDSIELGQEEEIWAPTPGQLRLYDIIESKPKLTLKFGTREFGPFHAEMLYRTLALDSSSTQFNPLEGKTKKGWLKVQRYDQADQQRLVMDVFVRLKIAGDVDFGNLLKASFEAVVLHSTLNTGTL